MKTALLYLFLGLAVNCLAKPNVVIFFTDDQGTLDANCYGSTDLYTPTMDRLAATGVRFTQAYAHTVCCPARAMLMTGRQPQRSGVVNWTQGNAKGPKGVNMPLAEITIAEMLKTAGYKTGLFGKWHLGAHLDHHPMDQGFDEYFGHLGGFIDNYNHYFLHGTGFHDLYDAKKEVFARDKYFPDLTTARALDFVDRHRAQAFLLIAAFNLPHYPEQADPQFDDRYKDLPMPRQSYAKVVSTVDDRMGRIMARLDQHGLTDNTIVIFMSDNGASREDVKIRRENHTSGLPVGHNYGANGGGGNSGKWRGQKGTFLEGGIRVPAIISYPAKLPKGIVRDEAVTAMDWLPTIAELTGVDKPRAELDGASVLPIITDAAAPTHYQTMHWGWGNGWAVRRGPWKLIGNKDKPQSLGKLDDPEPEAKNYLADKPELVAELLAAHKKWLAETTP